MMLNQLAGLILKDVNRRRDTAMADAIRIALAEKITLNHGEPNVHISDIPTSFAQGKVRPTQARQSV